jgi:anti-sigma-K factor RskA
MMKEVDPPRDPQLASLIRRAESREDDAVRVSRVTERVIAEARLILAGIGGERSIWDWALGWRRVLVPASAIAVAAAIVIAVAVQEETTEQQPEQAVPTAVEAVLSARTSSEVADALIGPANRDWLLAATVAQ